MSKRYSIITVKYVTLEKGLYEILYRNKKREGKKKTNVACLNEKWVC